MAGPGGPVNDIIRMLMDQSGKRLGARPSQGLETRMYRIDGNTRHAPGELGNFMKPKNHNVVPGPGSNKPISKDPWFDELTGRGGDELFVFVTNPRGKRIRVAGPFPDQAGAQQALDRLSKNSKGVTLDIGPWTPQPDN